MSKNRLRTALDAPDDVLDAHERKFVANIRDHGWFRTTVFAEGDAPGFSYTTGFWHCLNFPEVVVFSLRTEIAHDVLWDLFRDIKSGKRPPIGERTATIFGNTDAFLVPCSKSHYGEYLGWSRWFYGGDDFDCLQLVWPDRDGRFPWRDDCDSGVRDGQPDLTECGWELAMRR